MDRTGRLIAGLTAFVAGALPASAQEDPPPKCKGREATIVGTHDPETIEGTPGDDVIWGGFGDDVVHALGGDDLVCTSHGVDTIFGGPGEDRLFGQQQTDYMSGDAGDDVVSGERGNDTLAGGAGSDVIAGGDGPLDTASFAGTTESVEVDLAAGTASGEGRDVLRWIEAVTGGEGDDVIRGTADDDGWLIGGPGDDRLAGRGGRDVLFPLEGMDRVAGGPGRDTLSYAFVQQGATIGPLHGDGTERIRGIEAVHGTSGDDVMVGTAGDDVLNGGFGSDDLYGRGGDDRLSGGTNPPQGPDDFDRVVYTGAPRGVTVNLRRDRTRGEGSDMVREMEGVVGSRFDDVLLGGSATARLVGTEGDDRIDVAWFGAAVGGKGADLLVGSGRLVGGPGDDRLYAGRLSSHLIGGPGDDELRGAEAPDFFSPGPGDDLVTGGGPDAPPPGMPFADVVSFAGAPAGVVVDLAAGTATGEGSDSLAGIEGAVGSSFDDAIAGSDEPGYLRGGPGDDTVTGGDGDDQIAGDEGIDSADGGEGADSCDAEQEVNCEDDEPQ